jgi:superfamily II DNA/RNA helicase
MAPPIRKLADKFLRNPKEIEVARASSTATTVEAFLVSSDEKEKQSTLRAIVQAEKPKSSIVFCNRKRDISTVVDTLRKAGFTAAPMHGDLSQPKRMETLEAFRTESLSILVCSDVAARGIDIDHITHVINFDVPFNAEDYVHRIGRTGRAGRKGRAFMITTSRDKKLVDAIVDLTKKEIKSYDLGTVQKKQEEAVLQSVIEEAKARGVDAKTIKAAQKCFEQHIPAFILRAA